MAFAASVVNGWTSYAPLKEWVLEAISFCQPDCVYVCDGSQKTYDELCQLLVEKQTFVPLNSHIRPHSFWCHSSKDDVARLEETTFICSLAKEDAGPTNNWRDPEEMKGFLRTLFKGSMRGRTLYVIPFCMGPIDSPYSLAGVQITDSAYVACNMYIMTRVGKEALKKLEKERFFVPCLHSVGHPLQPGEKDVVWPSHPEHKYIVHFPEEPSVWSFGSGYGGNALLGKKSFALRIASALGNKQGWLAEHMLIMGVTNPEGEKKYFAAAFPSACGKTNLAMLQASLPGWKVECVGDDIAWMHVREDGKLYAINPEAGFFGVAPGTSNQSNPCAMQTIQKNTIFTNVALTPEKDVWWEGMSELLPSSLIDWQGNPWVPGCGRKAAHPNGRFTTPLTQCPILDPAWEDPNGVPISAILFGGRRSSSLPLVTQAFSWTHGVLMGASLSSETTAAAKGVEGKLRHDPFAMLPFCGYHMGDYFAHWLEMQEKIDPRFLPTIFGVNWFRKNQEGKFLWPGFQDNIRVIKWIFERCSGKKGAIESAVGYLPKQEDLDLSGLALAQENLKALFEIEPKAWKEDLIELESYFQQFGNRFPQALKKELEEMKKRLNH